MVSNYVGATKAISTRGAFVGVPEPDRSFARRRVGYYNRPSPAGKTLLYNVTTQP